MKSLNNFFIDKNIGAATTLPGWFYNSQKIFEQQKEAVFASSWQLIEDFSNALKTPNSVFPFFFMENWINEPLMLIHDANGSMRVLSNVCTHRGNLLVKNPCPFNNAIVCNYHGRRFDSNGQFIFMPKCEGMENFPTNADNLTRLELKRWRQFYFTSLNATIDFEELIKSMEEKIGYLPIEHFIEDKARSQDYLVKANWALYCDNYLEGFHIPFVHPTLANELNWNDYRTEIHRYSNVQIGIAKGGDYCFDLPANHPDFGQKIAGYYFWLWPNLMFNFYPWGLSLNIVRPLEKDLTKVSFRSFVYDKTKLNAGAGADVHRIELEDEAVVERVQQGTASRFYKNGRFSPTMEQGVHHFHRLMANFLSEFPT